MVTGGGGGGGGGSGGGNGAGGRHGEVDRSWRRTGSAFFSFGFFLLFLEPAANGAVSSDSLGSGTQT